ncbi:MAG: hypothetical protein HOV81_23275 [Kofleriaceae bacterium]|nr:hypothetical protein [Kofleriaceae bacterium]
MPFATCAALAACASGRGSPGDLPQPDAARQPDAREADASSVQADAPPEGCAIAAGLTPTLDGTDDMAEYPAAQQVTPGAMLGTDVAAIAWDDAKLYVTVASTAFEQAYEPLHIYVEAGTTLGAATPANGKEYGGLVPALPFSPTHLIAVRRVSDSGTGGYNGVFVPGDGWTARTLDLDASTFASADLHTLSVSVPWSALGTCPTHTRLALHVVHGAVANEWKDLVPGTHTPWLAPGGGFYEIDLTAPPAVSGWSLR